MSADDPLTSTLRPATDAVLTIRVIKSFPYRTVKNMILKDVDLTKTTVAELHDLCVQKIKTESAFRPYRTVELDTLKLYTKAHGSKTTNLVINLDHDEWILSDPSKTLAEVGMENETEVSLFNRRAYSEYKANPVDKW
ncbi:uncharacterized protein V1510DRAFT_422303 [Dipodascopsis tothii]|uniref:uncharacterized protein n=1 Tax=Dipodascopsis tothii TaxID=44089 RepID=UPI0034CD6CA5